MPGRPWTDLVAEAVTRGSQRPHDADDRANAPPPPAFPHPVFVGGTGRSGTTVVAQLIGQHSRYAMVPREARFHADGFPDLLSGRRPKRWFLDRLRSYWYFRVVRDGTERGLWNQVPPPEFDRAVRRFSEHFDDHDPEAAASQLLRDFFDPFARRRNRPAWVEMTPTNVESGPTLHALFPSMRLIHMVRDGRDVACSALPFPWAPGTLAECLKWWADGVRRADRGASTLPRKSVLVIQLEDLVRDRREETYARLLDFLELPAEPRMRNWFDMNMTHRQAHIGRWRSDVEPELWDWLKTTYRRILDELRADGVSCVPREP
jgi:Sulfotransferase family